MAGIHEEPFIRKNSFMNEQIGDLVTGFRFNMIMTDTKGNFLSCLENFKICVNNTEVCASDVFITISGRQYSIAYLPDLSDVFWNLNEDALITVCNGMRVEDLSQVEVSYGLRMSFLGDWEHRLVIPKYDKINFGGDKQCQI